MTRRAPATSVSLEQLGDEQVNELPASCPPHSATQFSCRASRPADQSAASRCRRNTHERLAHVARGDIVHPAMAGVPLFEREDVVLVPIDDLPTRARADLVETQ